MDLYEQVSYDLSRTLTLQYSSSFGMSSRLFPVSIRAHIYAIYGLVRIADEIVDTYAGSDKKALLDSLEAGTYAAIARGYSTNPIVHAFALTAAQYAIDESLIAPFFESMRMDLTPINYDQSNYETYIYGSAEVIGLMCLRVFCQGDTKKYDELSSGARALGSAYQKVNFLRDIAADYNERGRMYFPNTHYDTFDDTAKQLVVSSIEADFKAAQPSLLRLPKNSKAAVLLSVSYYEQLLKRLKKASVADIKANRLRISSLHKTWLFITTVGRNGAQK